MREAWIRHCDRPSKNLAMALSVKTVFRQRIIIIIIIIIYLPCEPSARHFHGNRLASPGAEGTEDLVRLL